MRRCVAGDEVHLFHVIAPPHAEVMGGGGAAGVEELLVEPPDLSADQQTVGCHPASGKGSPSWSPTMPKHPDHPPETALIPTTPVEPRNRNISGQWRLSACRLRTRSR